MKFILFFAFIAAVIDGIYSQSFPVGKTLVATTGSSFNIDCDVTKANISQTTWMKRTVGSQYAALSLGTTLIPSYSSSYSVTLIGSTTLRLTITSVTAAEYSTVYDCIDLSMLTSSPIPQSLVTVQLSDSSTSVCDTTGKKAYVATKVTAKASFSLTCNITGGAPQDFIWGKWYSGIPLVMFMNNSITDPTFSSMYAVTNTATTSTLKVTSADTGVAFYYCTYAPSGSVASDYALYAVCSASKKLISIYLIAMAAVLAFFKI